jgi:hypothetical protein
MIKSKQTNKQTGTMITVLHSSIICRVWHLLYDKLRVKPIILAIVIATQQTLKFLDLEIQ